MNKKQKVIKDEVKKANVEEPKKVDLTKYEIREWDFWMLNHVKSLLLKAGMDETFMDILPVIIQLGIDPQNHKQQTYTIPGNLKKYIVLHEDELKVLFTDYDPFKYAELWNLAMEILKKNKIDFFSES